MYNLPVIFRMVFSISTLSIYNKQEKVNYKNYTHFLKTKKEGKDRRREWEIISILKKIGKSVHMILKAISVIYACAKQNQVT